ncbi:MAG: flagellar assembly protein FliW [Lachnospiraceae bacterium]|nr:flagellar assembly protein FliW [Lachnospiraceae bacterium]
MEINTRIFGTIGVDEERIIHFADGIIGFPDMKDFTLIHDAENEAQVKIHWLQSIQEPSFAMPVLDPLVVQAEYNPNVEDELIKPIGELNADNLLVLVTLTVPKEIENMSVNLQAPLIINAENRKAVQVIVEDGKYPVKFPIYKILEAAKEGRA